MSFNIALSGINAAQKDLDTTANNIANVNTTGFKESRAEFSDVYSASLFSNSGTQVGEGVVTSDVAQQFNQGSFQFTNNSLDLAINGNGFFAVSKEIDDQDISLTRAGAFKLDSENYVVNSNGEYLKAFPVNSDGSITSVSLEATRPLKIPDSAGNPTPTANVDITANLQSSEPSLANNPPGDTANQPWTISVPTFDPTDKSTFTRATSSPIYDSLGQSYTLNVYYRNISTPNNPNTWETRYAIDDGDGLKVFPLVDANGDTNADLENYQRFDSSGTATPASSSLTLPALSTLTGLDLGGADDSQVIKVNHARNTQFASAFEVQALRQDGITIGRLTGIDIGANGLVIATYSNGQNQPLGKLALVRVANEQGLVQQGNTSWKVSQDSGEALAGQADSGSFGSIRSGTLEQSNVNLTTELVDLITAQRNFQASSRTLEVNNTVTQNILQIR